MTDIVSVICLTLSAAGIELTQRYYYNETWRTIRWFRTDYWHIASGCAIYLLPIYVWLQIGWTARIVSLALTMACWVLMRPRHWGYSRWDPRRYF